MHVLLKSAPRRTDTLGLQYAVLVRNGAIMLRDIPKQSSARAETVVVDQKDPSNDSATTATTATTTATVALLGLGYVGLPTALAMHDAGLTVIGIDISSRRISEIRTGRPDLLPSDMDRLALARQDPDRFIITDDLAELAGADFVIVAVPTPVDSYLTPDLVPLRTACAAVVASARAGQTIILTSTSYVGCTRDLIEIPLRLRGFEPGTDIFISFSPERIDPANTQFGQAQVPRVVGGLTPACTSRAAALIATISGATHLVSSTEAAELTKLLENTFRAVNISLANEFAEVAHHLGLDPVEIVKAAATKPFGFMAFYPGPGVGGHCIPCDPHYLLWQMRSHQQHPSVIAAAMESISTRPARVVERAAQVLAAVERGVRGARVLVAGVAYKPDIADVRESPALRIIAGLRQRGAHVSVYDPVVSSITVDGEVFLSQQGAVAVADYDLVVVCCLHASMDPAIFTSARLVLDATYKLPAAANRQVP